MRKALALGCSAILSSSFSLPAFAIESSYTAASESSPDAVWAKIGDFCGIANWGLGLKCALSADGKMRTLTTQDGGVVVEQLENRDNAARTYSYTIMTPGPLPVANYHSKIAVTPAGAGSSIVWSGKYDAKGASDADAKKVFDGLYKSTIWRNKEPSHFRDASISRGTQVETSTPFARIDPPFRLAPQWELNFRAEIPFVWTNGVTPENPTGAAVSGFGNLGSTPAPTFD